MVDLVDSACIQVRARVSQVDASPHDPYGMSYAVYEQVECLGRPQYRAGLLFGGGFWVLVVAGGIHRRLTTLQIRRLESAHAQ